MKSSQPLTDGRLSPDQQTAYWEDGYLFPLDILSPEEANQIRADQSKALAQNADGDVPMYQATR